MFLLPLVLTALPALADPKVEKVTGTVVVLAESAPISVTRPKQEAEGPDPDPPGTADESAMESWEKLLDRRNDRRDDYRSADAIVGWYASRVARCAADGKLAPGASAEVKLSFREDGRIAKTTPAKGADPALAACVAQVYAKRQTGAVFHSEDLVAPWTFTFQRAPEALPGAVDEEDGFAGVPFGGTTEHLENKRLATSFRNTEHYYRGNDEYVYFMGVRSGLSFGFDADEGFYIARVRSAGDSASFLLREALKERLGVPRWDASLKCWYWRGEHLVYVFETIEGSSDGQLSILDHVRARRAGLIDLVPGDAATSPVATPRGLPKVLREDAAREAAGTPAVDTPPPAPATDAPPVP